MCNMQVYKFVKAGASHRFSINYYIYSNIACWERPAKRTTCFLRVCKGTKFDKNQILPIKPAKKSSSSEIFPMHMQLHM